MAWKPAYCTPAELRAFLLMEAMPGSPTAEDTNLQASMTLACESASRVVDRFCGRQFGLQAAATERFYTARYNTSALAHEVVIDDLMTTTGLVIDNDGTTVDAADRTLLPLNASSDGRPWTSIRFSGSVSTSHGVLGVTGQFGWTTVPDAVKTATLMEASRFLKRKDAPFGVAGSSEMGGDMRLLAKVDVDAEVILREYRRLWGAM